MSVLPAPQTHTDAQSRIAAYGRTCQECARPYTSHTRHGKFCGYRCKTAFDNRRKTRGAELYDVYMACRYERGLARIIGLWGLLTRMAAQYRLEDKRERDGRPSWRPPETVRKRKAHLYAEVLTKGNKQEARSGAATTGTKQ